MDALLLLVKVSLLLALPLIAARLLRRAPAVIRHQLWTVTFAAVLALPLLAVALPALYVPMPAAWRAAPRLPSALDGVTATRLVQPAAARFGHARFATASGAKQPGAAARHDVGAPFNAAARFDATAQLEPTARPEAAASLDTAMPAGRAAGPGTLAATSEHARTERSHGLLFAIGGLPLEIDWPIASALLLGAWAVGTIAAITVLGVSLVRVRRLARTAEELNDAVWQRAADALGPQLGLRSRARLLASREVNTPMAAGVWRPVIFLPASARTWSEECRDVVLAHEIAHLAVRDPLRHLTARLAVACYWFHPLAWMAARQAAMAREQACDEAVLALGTRPSAYARVLLDLADALPLAPRAVGALPMVERSLLETRLMAILTADARPATRRRVLMPVIGVALLTLSVAAAQPAAPSSSTTSATSMVTTSPHTRSSVVASSAPTQPASGAVVATPAGSTAIAGPAVTAASTPIAASVTTAGPVTIARSAAIAVPAVPAVTATNAAVSASGAQRDADRDSACWWDLSRGGSFSGNSNVSTDASGRTVIYEQIGMRAGDRIIQKTFGDLRLCMVAEDVRDRDRSVRPSQWLDLSDRIVMEVHRGGNVIQRLTMERSGGAQHVSWRVGGVERPLDAAAQQWRDRMLATLDVIWELSSLRGQVSSLRGEISSIHGQESSLRGEISSLQGEVSSMRGRASSIRGEESSLRGRISSIEGHVSALRGAISSEQGAISSLNAARYDEDATLRSRIGERIKEHEARIARIEQEIRDYGAPARIAAVEREIAALDANGKVAAIETEIRNFNLNGKVAEIESRISALDVPGKIAAIERRIAALDADRRGRQLEERRDAELKRLEAAIAAIR